MTQETGNGGFSVSDLLSIASDIGVIGLLIAVLWGGFRRWWVWGWHYDEVRRERDEWREMALSSTDLAEKASEIAQRRGGSP